MAKKKWKKKERLEKLEEASTAEKSKNNLGLIAVIILLLVGGYLFFGQDTEPPIQTPTPPNGKYTLITDKPSTHIAGKVEIVEFFDFYCSHCYSFHTESYPTLKQNYGDKIKLIDYGYPLQERSKLPIEAYEIAKENGLGEELKDKMFNAIHAENKDISNIDILTQMAGEVGLDEEEFKAALETHTMAELTDTHRRLGNSYGLDRTPTLILDNNLKVIDTSVANLADIIDSILAKDPANPS